MSGDGFFRDNTDPFLLSKVWTFALTCYWYLYVIIAQYSFQLTFASSEDISSSISSPSSMMSSKFLSLSSASTSFSCESDVLRVLRLKDLWKVVSCVSKSSISTFKLSYLSFGRFQDGTHESKTYWDAMNLFNWTFSWSVRFKLSSPIFSFRSISSILF